MKNPKNINHLRKKVGFSLVALLGQQMLALPAYAAIYTWDGGGADSNLATAENWVGDVAPQNSGDGIIFTGTTQTTVVDNLGYGTVVSLDFDAAAGAFTLQGSSIGSNSGITNASANLQTFDNSQLTVFASQTWDAGSGGLDILTPDVLLLNNVLDVNLTITGSGDTLIAGVISEAFPGNTEAGSLSKNGTGTLTLSGNNTYSGGTIINDGTVSVSSDANLGDAAGVLVFDGGALQATASFTTSRDTTLNAEGGAFAIDGAGTTLSHDGIISGAGDLTKEDAGTLVLNGSNSYTGGTTVDAGTLQSGAAGSFVADTAYTVNGGVLDLNDFSLSMSSLSGSGGSVDLGSADITIAQSAITTYDGTVVGTGSVTKQGAGTLTLTGANTYSGGTTISAGTLSIDGDDSLGDAAGGLVFNGGTLKATASLTTGRDTTLNAAGGTLNTDAGTTLNHDGVISGAGALTKAGTGTLVLNAANVYAGGTTVSAGILQGDTTSLQGNITNNAVLHFSQATDGTYSGVISGTGSVSKNANGIVIFSGANTYSGGTTISAGTLQGDTTSLQGNILNNAALVFDQSANGTYEGNISGTGNLAKNGTGSVILTGTNTYTGGTTVSAGTLQGNTSSLQGDIANNATLAFNQDTNGSYAGVLSGSGTVNKQGSGVVTLSGANTFNGTTNITAGSLLVDGDLLGNIIVNNGTTLGGSGSLGNVTVNSGATLSPGNSPGMLAIDTLTLNAGSTTLMEINGLVAGTQYDQINVTNTAVLNGTLNLDFGFAPAGGDTFNLITAGNFVRNGNAVTGFASIVDNISTNLGAALTVAPVIGSNSFDILIEQGSFVDVAGKLTHNQAAVAKSLDSFSTSGDAVDLLAGLNMLSAGALPAAFDSLSGVQHVHAQTFILQQSERLHGLLANRLGQYGLQPAGGNSGDLIPDVNRNAWFNFFGGNGDVDASVEAAGADYTASGFAGGFDFVLDSSLVAGAALAYTRTNGDIASGDMDIDSYQASGYGRWIRGNGYLNGLVELGYHDTNTSRKVVASSLVSLVEADYSAATAGVSVEAGHQFQLTQIGVVAPYVALEYTAFDREGFTEKSGSSASLKVEKESEDSLRSHIGVRWQQQFALSDGTGLMPKVGFAWIHEFNDNEPGLDAGFAAASGSNFHVDGTELDVDRGRIEAGLAMQLDESSNFYFGYAGELAGSDAHQILTATYSLAW